MTNAFTARGWLLSGLGPDADVSKHFVAVSTNAGEVEKFGIDTANMFGFWEWVGGRYSMDSAIGLSLMLAIGGDGFRDLLAGFHAMDEHFRHTDLERNLPVLMGLLAVWYRDFFGVADARRAAVLAVPRALPGLPAAAHDGEQRQEGDDRRRARGLRHRRDLLGRARHQRAALVLPAAAPGNDPRAERLHRVRPARQRLGDQQDMLVANALAQAPVLALGRTADEVRADGVAADLVEHKVMPGNRPSTTLMLDRLSPFALGALVALYEHSVFVQGVVWGIELRSTSGASSSARRWRGILLPALTAEELPDLAHFDPSTAALALRYRSLRGR